jgi:hypothetical protein
MEQSNNLLEAFLVLEKAFSEFRKLSAKALFENFLYDEM